MSLVPLLFSDWWEDLDRPHRLWDQHFGLSIEPDDFIDRLEDNARILFRPNRRNRRRFHPFLNTIARKGKGSSIVQADKNKFLVTLDVQQFAPEEITVKVVDRNVVVEAKHGEKEDEHGSISRQFIRKYIVPSQCDIDQVESHLSSDGVLTIAAPRKELIKPETNERVIKVQYTGTPAVTNYGKPAESSENNDRSKEQTPQQPQQAQQHQQQHQQPHQGQRGRKSTVKAA